MKDIILDEIPLVMFWVGTWALCDWVWTKLFKMEASSLGKCFLFIILGMLVLSLRAKDKRSHFYESPEGTKDQREKMDKKLSELLLLR